MRRVTEGEQPEPVDDLEVELQPGDKLDPISGLRTELTPKHTESAADHTDTTRFGPESHGYSPNATES